MWRAALVVMCSPPRRGRVGLAGGDGFASADGGSIASGATCVPAVRVEAAALRECDIGERLGKRIGHGNLAAGQNWQQG